MNIDPALFAQYGIVGAMLGVFMWFHFRALKAGETREVKMDEQLQKNRKECREDTSALVTRIESMETRHHQDTVGIAATCAEALKMHAQAYNKYIESQTDKLPAIKGHV